MERCDRLRRNHGGRWVAIGRRRRQRPVVGRRQLLLHRVHHAPPVQIAHLDQHLRSGRRCMGQALEPRCVGSMTLAMVTTRRDLELTAISEGASTAEPVDA